MEEKLQAIMIKLEEMQRGSEKMEGKLDNVRQELSILREENKELKIQNQKLREWTEMQGTKIDMLERETRKKKLIIQAVHEGHDETDQEMEEKVCELINKLQIKIEKGKDIT